jgi:hypothetical protein
MWLPLGIQVLSEGHHIQQWPEGLTNPTLLFQVQKDSVLGISSALGVFHSGLIVLKWVLMVQVLIALEANASLGYYRQMLLYCDRRMCSLQ